MSKLNSYRRHRFPPDVIAHAAWLYFRFPLSLRMVEDLLVTRGVIVSHQTVRTWAENSHQAIRRRERILKRFKSPRHLLRFVSIHDPLANLFNLPRHEMTSADFRADRETAIEIWHEIAGVRAA